MTKRSAKRKATNATTEIVDLSSYERAVAKSEAAMMAMEERIEQEVIKEKLAESDPHAFRASFVLECEREDAVVIETSRALMTRTFEQNLNTHAAPLCVDYYTEKAGPFEGTMIVAMVQTTRGSLFESICQQLCREVAVRARVAVEPIGIEEYTARMNRNLSMMEALKARAEPRPAGSATRKSPLKMIFE